jgi:putative transposase
MKTRLQSFLLMLAGTTDKELAQQVQYLKEENKIRRHHLPAKIVVTPQERRRLLRFGKPLGKAINHLIGIVSPRTFARWLSAEKAPAQKQPSTRKPGRPRTQEQIRDLILRMAEENAWGYTRILGELRKLRIHNVSRTTIANVLRANGYEPGPKRGPGTWADFVRRHAQTLWACDFICKKVWTYHGLVEVFVLVVLHVGSRRVHVCGMTTHPDAPWMAQQAGELIPFFAAQPDKPAYLIRDLDGKFTEEFDALLESTGMEIVRVGPRAPNLNAFCERWIGSIKSECLSHFIVFGLAHLRYLVDAYVDWYNTVRPHQGVGNRPLTTAEIPEEDELASLSTIVCDERLGGLLRHYRRAA